MKKTIQIGFLLAFLLIGKNAFAYYFEPAPIYVLPYSNYQPQEQYNYQYQGPQYVANPCTITNFTATPQSSTTVLLVWNTNNCTVARISGIGTVPVNGSKIIDTTGGGYTLTASGPVGSDMRTVNVVVNNSTTNTVVKKTTTTNNVSKAKVETVKKVEVAPAPAPVENNLTAAVAFANVPFYNNLCFWFGLIIIILLLILLSRTYSTRGKYVTVSNTTQNTHEETIH